MKLPQKLTREYILDRVPEEEIYRRYFGNFKLNTKYCNHLRGDKSQPGFKIYATNDGKLHHFDFGSEHWKGGPLDLVRQIYNCDIKTALEIIATDFGVRNLKIIERPEIVHNVEERKRSKIQVVTKEFTSSELAFWNAYGLEYEDIKDVVVSIKSLYINRERESIKGDLIFGYQFGEDLWKIYRPFNPEKKWRSSTPNSLMYGLENVKNTETSIITKSIKDFLVIRKFITPNVASTQNESTTSISEENVNYIISNCKHPYVIFDNDVKGVESCKHYNSLGFDYWNVPKVYYTKYGIKDPSDFVYRYGAKRLYKEITKKIKC